MRSVILSFFFVFSVFAFDWQGHRGARGLYPENTIGSMKEAMKWPVTTLELDVVVSKDNKVVVSHEPWFNTEICNVTKKQNLYKLNYEDILKVDCGPKIHPHFPQQVKVSVGKPLLSRLLEETKEAGLSYNIEIKSTLENEKKGYQPDYKSFTDLVVKEILGHIPKERLTIQSFDWRVLKYLHEIYPDIVISALDEEVRSPEKVQSALGFTPQIYSPNYEGLSKVVIEKFHKAGMKVIPWTINKLEVMREVKSMGVDGIITDYPNLIPQLDQKQCSKNYNLFEGRCVKIPSNGLPSDKNPGWICAPGFQQKRHKCLKINLPANSHLTEDGKTWACNEGHVRYRSTCKKQ